MSGYSELKSSINRVIKTNDNREITGQILQNTLNSMVNSLGANYHFSGIASPITNPGTPDQNIFYVTSEEGTYVNFDRIELGPGLSFLLWRDNQWSYETLSTGDATKKWVQENYVSIDFFRSLFRAYDENGNEILPNNNPEDALPTVVDNIKAMVGFWTEQYLSALGHGPGGGGGGGSTTLDGLDDVELTSPLTSGQVLTFDAVSGKWVNGRAGTDITTVWTALAGNTSEQINISHLTDALADYATKTYVEQNFITVAYFDRLFRAYNGNTLINHNDVNSTIDNIKAMFGFWTDFYLSALGHNSQASDGITLDLLSDVTINNLSIGQVLTYNGSRWVNQAISVGVTELSSLADVTLTSLQTNQILIYDAYTHKWVNSSVKTINGQSLLGSGDISVGGGASGNYLPLTGGTITSPDYGALVINRSGSSYSAGIKYSNSVDGVLGGIGLGGTGNPGFEHKIVYWRADTGSNYEVFHSGYNKIYAPNLYASSHIAVGANFSSYEPSRAEFDIVTTSNDSCDFHFGANNQRTWAISARASANDYRLQLYCHVTNLTVFYIDKNGRFGMGSPSTGDRLYVEGNIYATGAITALSDARKKDIAGEVGVTAEQIAHAPAVQFLWKDKERRKEGLQVGTLAQYWQTVLPEVVSDKGGELSMQYGVAALVSSIIIARKVVDHERRIGKMEKWMKKWAEENDE